MKQFDCLLPELNIEGYHSLEASAGTGKTFAVQHLVSRFILQKIKIDEILVVTFTKASTRELTSRIRLNLASIFTQRPPYLRTLCSEKKIRAQIAVEEALACFDRAQIFTIHGFCQRMLVEYGFDLKLGPLFTDCEEVEDKSFLIREITDFLHTSLPVSEYSTKQLAALMDACNHDKDTLVKKLLYLIESKKELLDLPDYSASRRQFLNLEIEKPPLEKVLEWAPAFLRICDRKKKLRNDFLDQYRALLAKDFDALLTHPSLFSFFTKTNRSKTKCEEKLLYPLYTLGEKLSPLIARAFDPRYTLMRLAKKVLSHIKEEAGPDDILSPDDLLAQMKKALLHKEFHSKVRSRYRVVIIDEFQDTDPDQWAIFKSLFVDYRLLAFYLVADPKQSIYGFRNADLNTYFQAKKSMDCASQLMTNYRSQVDLICSLNSLFSKQSRFAYTPVKPPRSAAKSSLEDGKNALHFFTASGLQDKKNGSSSPILLETTLFFPFVAREIISLVEGGKASFRDFAILVKDRFQAARITSFLEKLNIPLLSKGGQPLKETLAFSLMEFLLKAVIDPKKARALLTHPIYQCTHHELKEGPSAEIAVFLSKQKEQPFHKMIQNALHYRWEKGKTLIELIVGHGRLDTYSDFMQIVELLLQKGTKASFEHLLDYLIDLPDQKEHCSAPLADANAVIITTIHASKGLEFSIVFALGLMQRNAARQDFIQCQDKWRIFSSQCTDCAAALRTQEEEKIRQLYVAMTRAKKRLYVPVVIDPKIPSTQRASPLELFLDELPPIDELIPSIGATQTVLAPDPVRPFCAASPVLYFPSIKERKKADFDICSFSSLHRHDANFFHRKNLPSKTLPKGVEMGLFFHSLIEKIIRKKLTHPYQSALVHDLIKTVTTQTKFAPHLFTIKNWIDQAFHCPLDGFCLADIPPHHLHLEVEFFYSNGPNTYLKGFIDLIFLYNKSYYILDWKTNDLPEYSLSALREVMNQCGYFLQSDIYVQALRRHLAFRADPYPIKGSYYLFLRGLDQGQSVYFIPEKESHKGPCRRGSGTSRGPSLR